MGKGFPRLIINKLNRNSLVAVAEHAQDLHLVTWIGLNWNQLKEPMRPGGINAFFSKDF